MFALSGIGDYCKPSASGKSQTDPLSSKFDLQVLPQPGGYFLIGFVPQHQVSLTSETVKRRAVIHKFVLENELEPAFDWGYLC